MPKSLLTAHRALERAQLGAAREHAAGHLARAEDDFADALAACERDPSAPRCLDLSYVATRRAQQAEAEASLSLAQSHHHRAHLALAARRVTLHGSVTADADADAPTDATEGADVGASAVASALERMAPHVPVATLPPRSLVIRLPGPQAFLPGKSVLLPAARRDLAQIVQALQAHQAGYVEVTSLVTDGDTQGLWRARTQAVLAYLIACGLPATYLTAGEASLADAAEASSSAAAIEQSLLTNTGFETSEVLLRWSDGERQEP